MNRIIEFLRKLGNWIFRIFIWSKNEFKFLWIALIPFIFGYILIGLIPTGIFNNSIVNDSLETRFRFIGLVLELLGIVLVAIGLNKTLKLFSGKNLLHIFTKIFKRFPKFGGLPPITGFANIKESGYDKCEGIITTMPESGMTIENRVALLEKRYQEVFMQLTKNKTHFENQIKIISDALNAECSERERGDKQSQQSLKEFAVGDAHLELMGVIWLFFGAIFATASTELALLFQLFIR